jgi:hypothetical protein
MGVVGGGGIVGRDDDAARGRVGGRGGAAAVHVDEVPARDAARAQRRGLARAGRVAEVRRRVAVQGEADGGGGPRVREHLRRHRRAELPERAHLGDLDPVGGAVDADAELHPHGAARRGGGVPGPGSRRAVESREGTAKVVALDEEGGRSSPRKQTTTDNNNQNAGHGRCSHVTKF